MKLSFSQENAFYHFGLEEGLSQESVLSLLKDSNGFLWIGTQDGLNRFDGNSFTVYTNNPNDSASVIDNYINKLIEHRRIIIDEGYRLKVKDFVQNNEEIRVSSPSRKKIRDKHN